MENIGEINDALVRVHQVEVEARAKAAYERAVRIIQLKAILDLNKPLYEELDKLTLELKDLMGTSTIHVTLDEQQKMFMHNGEVKFLAQEQVLTVVDNFAEKNTVFRPAGVKRFETQTETLEEHRAREAKALKKANAKK